MQRIGGYHVIVRVRCCRTQMVEELGVDVPDDAWGPYRDGVVMFVSYTTLGALPLLPYGFGGKCLMYSRVSRRAKARIFCHHPMP